MNQKAFRQLLKRYLDDSCTAEEQRIVDQWYELLDNGYSAFSPEELKQMEDRLWEKLQLSTARVTDEPYHKKGKFIWWRYSAAASILGVLLMSLLWFYNNKEATPTTSLVSEKAYEGHLKETNSTKKTKKIQLEDGSFVMIHPGSTLAFPKHFAMDRREVYLEGEAFFNVSKNANRPFFVYSNQIVTQVLGTSFGIRSKIGQIEVAVKTGKVAVYESKEQIKLNEWQQKSDGVIITPNQKVTYYQQERHFITSIVDQPALVFEESGGQKDAIPDFNYNETSLQKVLQDMENAYEIEIVLENEKIKNCLFTGDLTDENLFNKLEGICLAFSASYEVKGTKILLKGGKDCTAY